MSRIFQTKGKKRIITHNFICLQFIEHFPEHFVLSSQKPWEEDIYYCYFIQLAKKTFIKIIYSHNELTTRIKTSVNRYYYCVEKCQVKEKLAFMGNLKMVPIGTESYIIEHSGNQRGRMN